MNTDVRATSHGRRWRVVISGAVAVVVLAAGVNLYLHRASRLTEKDTVVLADFENTTGDPVFDVALRRGLSSQLEQSPFLNLLSDERIAQTLSLMAQPKDARLTHALAREVCQRTASAAVLDGTIAQVGSQYLLTLMALNCANGESLASSEAQASDKNHVLDALGKVASEIRNKLGESLPSVQKYDLPPENVTTSSLEALRAYSLGHEIRKTGDFSAAIPLLERAVSLDPHFAEAYSELAAGYYNQDDFDRAADNMRTAYGLRERVGEREKLAISYDYELVVTGNLEAGSKVAELWIQTYPRDYQAHIALAVALGRLGDLDRANTAAVEALKLNPSGQTYSNVAWGYLFTNNPDQVKRTLQEAEVRNMKNLYMPLCLYLANFLQHDAGGMQREAAELVGKAGHEDVMLYQQSDTAAFGGRMATAWELTSRAVASSLGADKRAAAAEYESEAALREALVGEMAVAKQHAQSALTISNGRDGEAMAAIALGLAGDSVQATRLAEDLSTRFAETTIVQSIYLPMIRAVMLRDGAKAVEMLAVAIPYEMGATSQTVNFSMYTVYLRGNAYLTAKQGDAAAAEFHRIIDHPGRVVNEPIAALAHLQLGRANAMSGDTAKARRAYQDFLTLWKDADPNVPILKEAQAEYAKLGMTGHSDR